MKALSIEDTKSIAKAFIAKFASDHSLPELTQAAIGIEEGEKHIQCDASAECQPSGQMAAMVRSLKVTVKVIAMWDEKKERVTYSATTEFRYEHVGMSRNGCDVRYKIAVDTFGGKSTYLGYITKEAFEALVG